MNALSPFASVAYRLVERGYSIVPIMPGSKAPGQIRRGQWCLMSDWPRYSERLPSRFELPIWCTWPDAGIGVVPGPAGGHVVGLDLDTDDPQLRAAVLSALPATSVIKRGRKGETRFFRGPNIARSKSWKIRDEQQVADLIGPGRQSALPPSAHPDTGRSYRWIGPDALEDIDPRDLVELTPGHIAAINEALRPFGYREPQVPVRGPSDLHFVCDDTRGREWGLGVLRSCAQRVAQAKLGYRNNALSGATATVAGKPGFRGWVAKEEALDALFAACLANGYLDDDGESAFYATFNGQWTWGLAHPLPGPIERLAADPAFAARLKLKPKSGI